MSILATLLLPPRDVKNQASTHSYIPIIMYHSICDYKNNDYVLSVANFENDMRYIKEKGYTPIFMRDIIDFVENDKKLPNKPIVLSFDDGFYNNYSIALPIMKRYNFKFSVSVVGKYIEKEKDEKIRNSIYSYLNFDEISEMQKSGLVELSNHSYDMHSLRGARAGVRKKACETSEEYEKNLIQDAQRCSDLLLENCKVKLDVFVFPYGYYNNATVKILEKAGYKSFLTCNEGINDIEANNKQSYKLLKRYNRPSRYSTNCFFEKIDVR